MTNLPKPVGFSEALVRQISLDVGKQVVAHIEHAYPEMFRAVAGTAKLSIRNATYIAIMEAVRAANEGAVEPMLDRHGKHRRTMRKLRNASGPQSP